MIHYHYFITHKPSLSLEEFFHYWREKHPLAGGRTERTRRYIQSHRIPSPAATPSSTESPRCGGMTRTR